MERTAKVSRKSISTITITVNVATGDMNEGNAEIQVNFPSEYVGCLNEVALGEDFQSVLKAAIAQYVKRNAE